MTYVLIASDSPSVQAEVSSVLPKSSYEVEIVSSGPAVMASVKENAPDLAILDFQIGNMGGMAICLDIRLETSGDRLPAIPTLLLLDRRADVFMARRAGSAGWVMKPLDPIRMRKAIEAVLAGDVYEDETNRPATIATR